MQRAQPDRGRNLALLVAIVALLAVVGALAAQLTGLTAGPPSGSVPPASSGPSTAPSGASLAPLPSETPGRTVSCRAEAVPLPSALASDPCPSAILAVEVAVAPVRLPIQRVVIEPGPFFCDIVWPGAVTAPPCYASFVRPGQYMHAWVSFTDSTRVAAVALGLNLPPDLNAPSATRPPWNATLIAIEDPPSGWVMP